MVSREIESYRQVTNVVPDTTAGSLIGAVGKIGSAIIEANQEAKITENFSRAQLELNKMNMQYQTEYESNPLAGMDKLKESRKALFDTLGGEISPFFRGKWDVATRELGMKNDANYELWAYSQARKNTVKSINQSIANNMLQAQQAGAAFAHSNEEGIGGIADFAMSKSRLAQFGDKHLGAEQTTALLEGYDKDYMKSFLSGVAETSTAKAAALLKDPSVDARLSLDDKADFISIIQKTQKKQELVKTFQQAEGAGSAIDIVNSDMDYMSKRLEIDKMEMTGMITSDSAAKSRRVLSSQKDVDAVTSSDDMADIITQIYDLNAIADTNQADYMTGIQNVRENILDMQARGKINSGDVNKLNNQIKTLTAAKMSDATQKVGMEFYDANQQFVQLPPEYRGKATRELFYKSHGQEFTPEQYKGEARKIIDRINSERRARTVKTLQTLSGSDDEFLKSIGKTMDDVRETAKNRGMTEREVIDRIKAKVGK